MITALVLAAGASRRMGDRNKLLLPFRGRPLIEHVVRTVLAARVGEVVVVLGHEAERVRDALRDLPVAFAHNERFEEGMTTSIQAGLAAASPDAAGYLICLSDLPLIEPAELDRLVTAFERAREADARAIGVPAFEGRRGNPVLFAAHYRPDLLAHRGMTGCKGIVRQHPEHVVEVEMDTDHVLQDVDTPEAYERVSGGAGSGAGKTSA